MTARFITHFDGVCVIGDLEAKEEEDEIVEGENILTNRNKEKREEKEKKWKREN